MKKLALIAAAAVLLAFGWTSCSKSSGKSGSKPEAKDAVEQKLVFALHNEPDGLDPGITSNSFASPILYNTFEGLIKYDEQNNIIGACAESWDISADGRVYTFHLRKDMKWSDGSTLNAEDFVYSYLRVLDPGLGAKYSGMMTDYIVGAADFFAGKAGADAVGIRALDENTLEIELIQPIPYFIGILGMWVFDPVNKATVEANGDKWTLSAETFVSNGPFRMEKISFGEGYELVKNEHYWDAGNVRLEKLNFRFIPDPSTALVALDQGDIDGQWGVPPSDLPALKASSDALVIVPSYACTYYEVNCAKAPYDDPRVRLALAKALDRKALIENVLQSTDMPAYSLIAPGYAVNGVAYEEGRSSYGLSPEADVEGARALLAEAGYPDGRGFPVLELSYYTNETVKTIVEAMQQMWEENLGIKVNVSTEEWAVYYENIQALNYDVGAMGWGGDYLHPMTFFGLRLSEDINNNSGYANPEYDALIDKAKAETDPMESMRIMREAEDLLMADMPLIPLYYRASPRMMAPYVKGWYITPLNNMYLSGAYIEK